MYMNHMYIQIIYKMNWYMHVLVIHARNHIWHISDNHQSKRSHKVERKQSRVHVRVGREKWGKGNDATI